MKQWHLQEKYKNVKKIKFIIGDVKDPGSLDRAIKGSDYVIHAAATKLYLPQKKSCGGIKTNINGAINLINSCINNNVKKLLLYLQTRHAIL